jgi:small subunit ribosomal protein S19e
MTTAYDVPAEKLIDRLVEDLRKKGSFTPPEWADVVKTGVHRERAPVNQDWWYKRVAAVLRKVYVNGPIGTEQLAALFGGRVDKGSAPYHAWTGSRSIIRLSLKQLESAGLVQKDGKKGRKVTPAGQKLLNNLSHEVMKELVKDMPDLQKYA